MNRYKVLPLPFPFKVKSEEEWEFFSGEEGLGGLKKIEPIFNKDGWYYDRHTKITWVECKFGCWETNDPEMFLYILKLHNHPTLPPNVRAAIKTLISYNICSRQLIDLLRTDNELKALERTRRSAARWRLKSSKNK